MKKRIFLFLLLGTFIGLAIGYSLHPSITCKGHPAYKLSPAQYDTGPLINLEETFIAVAEEIKPSVVNLSIEKSVRGGGPFFGGFDDDFFGSPFNDIFKRFFDNYERRYKTKSLGSGVIIDRRGYILTNNHVIEGADEIKVRLLDGRSFNGRVKGQDPKSDLALIKIEAKDDLPVVRLGDSDKIRIGSWAIAIGNPFGLEHTVTVGVVSAKGRAIGAATYEDFIQTDASINPGNSGGPLCNIRGEVIGINTAIVAGGQGIGFAIPINMAKKIINDLIEKGKVSRAYLGVTIQNITEELARYFQTEPGEGVLISDVMRNSPAKESGLREGDIIKEINGKKLHSAHELQREVSSRNVGEKVRLLVLRDGSKVNITATLRELPSSKEEGLALKEEEGSSSSLGLSVEPFTKELGRKLNIDEDEEGVIITDVRPGSPGDLAGLKEGDLIKEINRKPVKNISSFNQVVKEIDLKKGAIFLINRQGQKVFVSLTMR